MKDTFCLAPDERQDFVDWYFKDIAYRPRSKDGPQPLRSKHLARSGNSSVRGSDQAERIFVTVSALVASGCSEKEACLMVADSPYVKLGQSLRGRPKKNVHATGLQGKAETVRTIFNRHKRRDTGGLVADHVGRFQWFRSEGIVEGSDYVKDSGLATLAAWRRHVQRIKRG